MDSFTFGCSGWAGWLGSGSRVGSVRDPGLRGKGCRVCTFGVLSLLLGCLGLFFGVGHFCDPCWYVFCSCLVVL